MANMIYRIIDVNLNRAREATRVIEDYARFVLENPDLSAGIRDIRHRLVNILKLYQKQLLASRDIANDVGKETSVSARTMPEVVISNFSRLSESLRSISEYLKTNLRPSIVKQVEQLRFESYELQQRFSYILYPRQLLASTRLYAILPAERSGVPKNIGEELPVNLGQVIEILVKNVDIIQLRLKGESDKYFLATARLIRRITQGTRTLFIVNDRVDIALSVNADGVHLGVDDLGICDARRLLGPDRIIGATTHNIKEARTAQAQGADYISVGPFFDTTTKPGLYRQMIGGFAYLKDVVKHIRIPYFAIGGLNHKTLPKLVKYHRRLTRKPLRIAVSSAIFGG